ISRAPAGAASRPARVAGMLGDGPAVLAGQLGQQAQHERPRPAPRFHPAETAPGPGHQLIEYAQPPAGAYAGASGHQTVFTCHHKPGGSDGGRPVSSTGTPKITLDG